MLLKGVIWKQKIQTTNKNNLTKTKIIMRPDGHRAHAKIQAAFSSKIARNLSVVLNK